MGQQPQTRREIKEAQRGRGWLVPTVIGVLALAVIAAAVWFGKGLLGSSEPTGSPSAIAVATNAPTASSGATSSAATPSADATTTTSEADVLAAAVESCRTAWKTQVAARDDAYRSLRQWGAHLKIMNDLQANKITLAQAKAAWPATTANAAENVAAFRNADKARAASQDTCAVDAAASGPQADAIRQCAASMQTVDDVLVKARVAIAAWETHLKDQSHFKAGGMTPAAAEAAWRVLWKKGLATLPPWDAVAAKAQQATCNLPA
jgi:cytoskeletal protein RodZ